MLPSGCTPPTFGLEERIINDWTGRRRQGDWKEEIINSFDSSRVQARPPEIPEWTK